MRTFLTTLFSCIMVVNINAQNANYNWSSTLLKNQTFIENKGQFNGFDGQKNSEILYAVDGGSAMILFAETGLTYRFVQKHKNKNRERGDRTKPRYLEEREFVHMKWEGANPDAQLVAVAKASDSHTYAMLQSNRTTTELSNISGYHKLIYKNLYPNIDVEYVFHEEEGIKYTLMLHSGADISQVKMSYSNGDVLTIDEDGNLLIKTSFGDIVDHAPITYYADNTDEIIHSSFHLKGNKIEFQLGDYDASREVVVDPWTVAPSFSISQRIWDIDVDANSNVYIYGGDTPMRLQKYDAAGILQWTYNTPWDTANFWLGTMITEPNSGDCFITAGTDPRISRINTLGTQDWTNNGGPFDEYWKLSFNCDYTRLMLGGSRLVLGQGGAAIEGYGQAFEIDMNDGSQLNTAQVATLSPGPLGGLSSFPNEVRAMCPSPNGKYYYLTLDTIGVFTDNLTMGYQNNSTYGFSYQVAGYGATNIGINAMAATTDYIYTQNGSSLDKRNIVDGSIIASVAIPNGLTTTDAFGFNSVENGGLVLDSCGNVYVGSGNGVYKFDENLNAISSATTANRVFDVAINNNGEVVACGQSFVASVDLSPCNPPKAVCFTCLELTPAGPYCQTDGQDTLMAEPGNGVWSGPGIIDEVLGIFDPSVADTGTHVIYFAPEIPLVCGIDSIVIEVNYCVDLLVCVNLAGDLNITNGTGPFTWSHTIDTLDCSACVPFPGLDPCDFPPGCSIPTTMLVEYATGESVTPTGNNWPMTVEDSEGNILQIDSVAQLFPCEAGCFISVNLPDTIVACTGDSANATAIVAGAIGDVLYSWSTTPEQTTETAVDLAPGFYYYVTVTDDSLCTAMDSVFVTQEECLGPIVCVNPFGDLSVEGMGPFTWSEFVDSTDCSACLVAPGFPECSFPPGCAITVSDWFEFSTGETVTPTGNWPIQVEDGNGLVLEINSISELDSCPFECFIAVDVPEVVLVCVGDTDAEIPATVSGALGTLSYSWSTTPEQTTATATGLGVGTYTVTVTDQAGCTAQDSALVSSLGPIVVQIAPSDSICFGATDGTATASSTGGWGNLDYAWNTTPAQSGITATGLVAGLYEVTVTDQAGCTGTETVTIESYPENQVNAGDDVTICQGEQVELSATGSDEYLWSNAAGENVATVAVSPQETELYQVQGIDVNDCVSFDDILITVVAVPLLSIEGADSVLCDVSQPIQLLAFPTGGVFAGNGITSEGLFDPSIAGDGVHSITYSLNVTDECVAHSAVSILVDENLCDIIIPNVFNPSTDFLGTQDFCGNVPQNNAFNLPCLEWYPGNRVRIFDRWGRKHYDQTDYHLKPWDGGNQSDGVYYYIVEFPDKKPIKGFFHLQR